MMGKDAATGGWRPGEVGLYSGEVLGNKEAGVVKGFHDDVVLDREIT